jgi:hypothetical protein
MIRCRSLLLIAGLWSQALLAQHPVDGVWILDGIEVETPAPLTARGQAIQDAYDLLNDDPSLRCEAASLARVYGNPNTRTGIRLVDGVLLVEHELFDIKRNIVPAGSEALLEYPAFGIQVFELDGERIRVHSSDHSAGYIRTGTGYPQGDGGSVSETFWRDGADLMVELVYTDPVLFDGEYRVLHRLQSTGETSVPLYDCTDADYDWFEQLNAEAAGEVAP